MEDQVQIKLEWQGALRRATVSPKETLAGLKRIIASLLGLESCDVTYVDEEGDVITVGSDVELKQLLEVAVKEKKAVRFSIKLSSKDHSNGEDQEADEEEEEAPKEREFPFANLARALSEAENVQRIQAVFQSPIVTETLTSFARAYVESNGDAALAGLITAPQVPALLGLLAELLNDLPVLKDLQDLITQHLFQSACAPPFANPACGPAFGGGPHGGHHGHHGPHGHHGHHGPHGHHGRRHCGGGFGGGPGPFGGGFPGPFGGPGHFGGPFPVGPGPFGGGQAHVGVFCDGCASDAALKQTAMREGHVTHRGFIRGLRYKSESVHDFDLCESCKANSERFSEAAYGPFTEIAPPQPEHGPGGRGQKRCWGWQRRHGGPDQASWRHEHQQQARDVPQAEPVPAAGQQENEWSGFFNVVKDAIKKGSEAFAQQGEGELSDIARAIAESLREPQAGGDAKAKPAETATAAQEKVAEQSVLRPVEVAQPAEVKSKTEVDPFVKWAQQLSQLQTLGFDRLETYIDFLEEEKGDLERVVNRIVRRDM